MESSDYGLPGPRQVGSSPGGIISSAVTSCLRLFRQLLVLEDWSKDATAQPVRSTIKDEETRFKVWSGNIGAHKTGRSSLEYRLRDASHLQKQVLRLLGDLSDLQSDAISILRGEKAPWNDLDEEPLRDGQDECFPGDLPDTELGQISTDIVEVVGCLLRLSVSIRNPAPHDRFVASASTDTSHYEQFDTQHVKSKFGSTIDEALAARLGKAISRRRQYFKYRQSHHAKLSHGLEADSRGGMGRENPGSTIASSIPPELKDTPAIPTQTHVMDEDNVSDTAGTQTSFASSVGGTARLRFPPLPQEAEKGPFECPFCYMMIVATNAVFWKRHVCGDLRPYICLSEGCQSSEQQFSRRRDWMQHELQNHWKIWFCPLECDAAVEYRSGAALKLHLETTHKTFRSNEGGLDALVDLSAQPLRIQDGVACPLCGEVLVSKQSYRRHVGRHQEQLALFALPNISENKDEESANADGTETTDDDVTSRAGSSERSPGSTPRKYFYGQMLEKGFWPDDLVAIDFPGPPAPYTPAESNRQPRPNLEGLGQAAPFSDADRLKDLAQGAGIPTSGGPELRSEVENVRPTEAPHPVTDTAPVTLDDPDWAPYDYGSVDLADWGGASIKSREQSLFVHSPQAGPPLGSGSHEYQKEHQEGNPPALQTPSSIPRWVGIKDHSTVSRGVSNSTGGTRLYRLRSGRVKGADPGGPTTIPSQYSVPLKDTTISRELASPTRSSYPPSPSNRPIGSPDDKPSKITIEGMQDDDDPPFATLNPTIWTRLPRLPTARSWAEVAQRGQHSGLDKKERFQSPLKSSSQGLGKTLGVAKEEIPDLGQGSIGNPEIVKFPPEKESIDVKERKERKMGGLFLGRPRR